MKFFSVVTVLACAATALAQGIRLGAPSPGQRIPLNRPFTVQVIKNNHILSSIEVGIAIGIQACRPNTSCPSIESGVGTVLYKGPYNPVPHNDGNYQNFTVTVPFREDLIGRAQLNVARFFLIGANNGASTSYAGTSIRLFPL